MSNPLIEELKKQIAGFENEIAREEIGTVLEVGDGVARVSGLTDVLSQEMVEFVTATGETIVGVVLNLEEDEVGVMLLSETGSLKEGDVVFARTGASVGKSYLYELHDGELVFAGFLIGCAVQMM